MSVLLIVVLYNCKFVIDMMHNIDPQLADKAVGYLHAIMWGAPGYLFFQVMRNQCEGLSKTKPGMVIGFLGLLVNIPINYIFIYGKFGMPELGGVGCGVATGSVYWIMFLMMRWYVKRAPSQRDIKRQQAISAARLGGAEAPDRHRHAGGAGAVLRSHAVRRGGAAGFAAGDRCGCRPPDRA